MLMDFWERTFGRMRFRGQFLAANLIALLAGLPVGLLYLSRILQLRGSFYLAYLGLAAAYVLACVAVNRLLIPRWLAPIREHFARRRRGYVSTPEEAAEAYQGLGAFPLRATRYAALAWLTWLLLSAALLPWLFARSWFGVLCVALAGVVAATIHLTLAYFLFKAMCSPHVEAAAALVSNASSLTYPVLPFAVKYGVLVMCFVALSLGAFGILITSTANTVIEDVVLQETKAAWDTQLRVVRSAPEGGAAAVVEAYNASSSARMHLELVDAGAEPAKDSPLTLKEIEHIRATQEGTSAGLASDLVMHFSPVGNSGMVLVGVIPWDNYRAIARGIARTTALFVPVLVFLLGAVLLLGAADMSHTLKRLGSYSTKLAEGDLRETPNLYADDEVAVLTRELHRTVSDLSLLLRNVKQSGQKVSEAVRGVEIASREISRGSVSFTELVGGSSHNLSSMDSSIQMIVQAVTVLSNNLEEAGATILEMKASVEEIAGNTEHLFSSAEQTSSSMNEISSSIREMTDVADQLRHLASATSENIANMDRRIHEIRQSSQETSAGTATVRQTAERGRDVIGAAYQGVRDTRDAARGAASSMETLVGSVERVDKILTVIREIAEQTNMLALNASIIAASAGEHGRSFGVVAGQIRELSQRTSASTADIGNIIQGIQKSAGRTVTDVQEGLKRADKALSLSLESQESFNNILEQVGATEAMSRRIAQATEDQTGESRRATEAIREIADMAESIHRAVREQTAGADQVASEAEKVREVAYHVKNATEEQAKGGILITEAIEQIQEDLNRILQASQAQANESQQILAAIQQMGNISGEHGRTVQRLNAVVADLDRSSKAFRGSVERFRTRV